MGQKLTASGKRQLTAAGKRALSCACCSTDDLCVTPCGDLDSAHTPHCPICATDSTSTPRLVRVTVAGFQTLCHFSRGAWTDLNGVLLNKTWTLAYVGACIWTVDDPDLTERQSFSGNEGDPTCGTPSSTTSPVPIDIRIFSLGLDPNRVNLFVGSIGPTGSALYVPGQKTYVIPLSTGTATVVFCP